MIYLKILGVAYLILIVVAFVATLINIYYTGCGFDAWAVFPSEIMEIENLNLFGAVLLSVCSIAANPITVLCRLLYWLFHVKKEE